MISVRIERKPEFKIVGRKIWISGTDNELFGQFWQQCKDDGLLDTFREFHKDKPQPITNSISIGVSCVEKDPSNRSFYFYIGTEWDKCPQGLDLEEYVVPACQWAKFKNQGTLPDSLIEKVMDAFTQWLPNSSYVHANAPELEVYPPYNTSEEGTVSEFWLPIKEKGCNN